MAEPVSQDVGTRLLFENERVRVWDLRLAPGESTAIHRHGTDYLYVVIGDGELQRVDADGTPGPIKPRRDGDVVFRKLENEDIHAARNAGEAEWRNIVVELKQD